MNDPGPVCVGFGTAEYSWDIYCFRVVGRKHVYHAISEIGESRTWTYELGCCVIRIAFLNGKISSWAAYRQDFHGRIEYVGGDVVLYTADDIKIVQMQAANCVFGPGWLSETMCSAMSQCDEEHINNVVRW